MAHPPPYPSTGDNAGVRTDRVSTARPPWWRAYLIWIIVIVLILLMVVLHLTGIVGAGTH